LAPTLLVRIGEDFGLWEVTRHVLGRGFSHKICEGVLRPSDENLECSPLRNAIKRTTNKQQNKPVALFDLISDADQ
jgi:hypothetical protein